IRFSLRMLQEAVDALFDNGRRGRVITGANKRPLKSLSDMLKGKQGRFRQNLLGKRVDFSGRSVIVTGPELKLHQCGLPKKMALELFKPFIYSRLDAKGLSSTVKQAKKLVEKERPEVWDILDEVIREHPVMLNRAPTLHRLGIQAFEPVLIEGKAIQLHPLVCAAFNADFDGDQMAVHVPLSLEAQLEARVLMMSTNNVLSPANGKPIIVPSQDMILGLYYISLLKEGEPNEGMIFADQAEIEHALAAGIVNIHTKIVTRFHTVDEHGEKLVQRVETTPGRMMIANLLPRNQKVPFDVINRVLRKREVGEVIDTVYRHCGQKESVIFCDRIMSLGFTQAFKAGISFGKDDMVIPEEKWKIVNTTREQVKEFEQQYQDGLITSGEKYNKVVDAWAKCTDKVAAEMMDEIKAVKMDEETGREREPNSVYMMSHSGARGSPTQMRQLAAMRGLMAKPSGEIIETPIVSNFKEGLTVLEYFNSTHGARKGLADTALKTANSGYLTRRLVDVAQDCIIKTLDCGTQNGITAAAVVDGGNVISSIGEQVLGRFPIDDILDPVSGEIIHPAMELIEERHAQIIDDAKVQTIKIRSPLTCELKDGICATCYGRDLARGTMVNEGEAVGIIAAQSIGEPGTQLTMRTFHIGGAANVSDQSFLESTQEGRVQFQNPSLITNPDGETIVMARNMQIAITDEQGRERATHKVTYGTKLLVTEGEEVGRGARLAEWDPYTLPIIAEKSGKATFIDLTPGVSVREETDDATGISQRIVSDWRSAPKGNELRPAITLADPDGNPVRLDNGNPAHYFMSVDAILSVEDGAEIQAGSVLARIPREGAKTKDITGGLPRVAELFEARRPKDHAIIAEIDGTVRFEKDYKNKRRIVLEPLDETVEKREYLIPKGKHITVQEGDVIQKGEFIMDGNPAPHDILAIMGVEALAGYLVNEIQDVYRLQGVKINDKHIEVIVRQMLQKIEISASGDSTLLPGEQVDRVEFDEINEKLEAQGKRPAEGAPVLLGITKASLQTRSFISAASFQETTRVLTEASVQGKRDRLVGLKENVIVGRLIPAGTGGATTRLKLEAQKRDRKVIEEREAAAAEAAAALEVIDADTETVEPHDQGGPSGFGEIL
ncbi:MAG: DNA-directed RNA polymerase subunit beta', partial [Pseudomonadota bacterium]